MKYQEHHFENSHLLLWGLVEGRHVKKQSTSTLQPRKCVGCRQQVKSYRCRPTINYQKHQGEKCHLIQLPRVRESNVKKESASTTELRAWLGCRQQVKSYRGLPTINYQNCRIEESQFIRWPRVRGRHAKKRSTPCWECSQYVMHPPYCQDERFPPTQLMVVVPGVPEPRLLPTSPPHCPCSHSSLPHCPCNHSNSALSV